MRKTQSEFATVLLRKAFQNGFVKGMAINLVGQCLAQNDKEMYTEHEQETMFGSFLTMLDNHPANTMCASIQQPDPEKAIAKGMRVILADQKLTQDIKNLRAQIARNAEILKRLEPSAPKPPTRVEWPADMNTDVPIEKRFEPTPRSLVPIRWPANFNARRAWER